MLESAAASTPASGLGRIIDGRYRLEEKLGGGSAGSTYRARRVSDARTFAIKLYEDDVSADAARRSRFEWEAATLAGLGHPNVVSIVDYGVFAGRRYLVSEWLDGENLAQRMRRGSLPLTAAVGITRQVLAALASAHGARLAHRNLKPSDVFLEFRKPGRERVKLLDFAPAMSSPRNIAKAGRSYAAPELAAGEPLDARSDVYAVGALLSGMLYGGPSDVPVLAGPASAADRSRRGPTVDSTLQGWIRRATARDRLERFNDAAEMLQQLIDLLPRDLRSPPDSYETSRVSSLGIPSPLRNDGRRSEVRPAPEQQHFATVRGYTLHIEEARPRKQTEVVAEVTKVKAHAAVAPVPELQPAVHAEPVAKPVAKIEAAASAGSNAGKRARLRPREALELAAAAVARGEKPVAVSVVTTEAEPRRDVQPVDGVDTWRAAIASLSESAPAAAAPVPAIDARASAVTGSAPHTAIAPGRARAKRKSRAARRAERRANKAAKRARNGRSSLAVAAQAELERRAPKPVVDRSPVSRLHAGDRGASQMGLGEQPERKPAGHTPAKLDRPRKPGRANLKALPSAAPPARASEPARRTSRSVETPALRSLIRRAANSARVAQSMSRRGLAETRTLAVQSWVATTTASRGVVARVSPVLARSPLTAAALGFSALFAVFVAMIGPGKDVRSGLGSLSEVADTASDTGSAETENLDTAQETSLAPAAVPSAAGALLGGVPLGVNTGVAPRGPAAVSGPVNTAAALGGRLGNPAAVGGRAGPPARNPWAAALPAELEGVPALAEHAAPGDEVLLRKLREYSRAHPRDPRAALLLGRVYLNRLWRSDAVAQFALALERDPTARGAPEVLPALLELIVLGKASSDAEALVIKAYGREALAPIETHMRMLRRSASVARLRAVRDKLASPGVGAAKRWNIQGAEERQE